MQPTDIILGKFWNGELRAQIQDNVRGCHCVVIQTSADTEGYTLNDHFMQTLVMIHNLFKADAASVSVVYPFWPYARSDKRDDGRVGINASLSSYLMEKAKSTSFIAVDLHAGQIQGFSMYPFDNLYGMNTLISHLRENLFKGFTDAEIRQNFVIVSPDQGGSKRARAWGAKLGLDTAVMDKHRNYSKPGTVVDSDLIGNVDGKMCILVDDMIDTGGTMMSACRELKAKGAVAVHIIVTHGVFSKKKVISDGETRMVDPLEEIMRNEAVESVIVSNTIDQSGRTERCPKLQVVDFGPLVGEAIRRHRTGESVSDLVK
jgi:ribose-phosphate pyrophosphokinase